MQVARSCLGATSELLNGNDTLPFEKLDWDVERASALAESAPCSHPRVIGRSVGPVNPGPFHGKPGKPPSSDLRLAQIILSANASRAPRARSVLNPGNRLQANTFPVTP